VVVDERTGVVKVIPVPNNEPPVNPAYQLTVPADGVAPNVTVPVPQIEAGVVPVIVGKISTVTGAVVEYAGEQLPLVKTAR